MPLTVTLSSSKGKNAVHISMSNVQNKLSKNCCVIENCIIFHEIITWLKCTLPCGLKADHCLHPWKDRTLHLYTTSDLDYRWRICFWVSSLITWRHRFN